MQVQQIGITGFSLDREETQQLYEVLNAVSTEDFLGAGYTLDCANELIEFVNGVWRMLHRAGFRLRKRYVADEVTKGDVINDL